MKASVLAALAGTALALSGAVRGDAFPRLTHSVEMHATVTGFGARDSTAHAVSGQSASYVRVELDITAPGEFAGRKLAVWSQYPTMIRKHRLQRGDAIVFTWLPRQDPNALVFEKLPNLRLGNSPPPQ
jgi:hypothetical protein